MNTDELYVSYRGGCGNMNKSQFESVVRYEPSSKEIVMARNCLSSAYELNGLGAPSGESVEIAAKLIGGLGSEVPRETDGGLPHRNWVLMESSVLAKIIHSGKNKVSRK